MKMNLLIPALALFSPTLGQAQAPQVDLWLNDRGTYEQGDRMRIFFRTDMDAYVTVVRVTTEGHVRILFPEGPGDNNYVAGGADYEVVQYGRSDYRVYDTPGDGYVFAVTSTVPFDYASFANGAVWDYHLLAFDEEADRDPYDTFAHFMDDILVPDTRETFSYEAAGYSVDDRGSRYYANAYRYYSRPYYQDCNVYRAFWGLRPYYTYDYDCRRVGVTVILGSSGHYYHDSYYHYGYSSGYDPYYYGYGSVYRYRYASGGYRHNHGARRVTNRAIAGFAGTSRHSVPNRGGITGRRSGGGRGPAANAAPPRRTGSRYGSPGRRGAGTRSTVTPRTRAGSPNTPAPRRRTTRSDNGGSTAIAEDNEVAPRREVSHEDAIRRRGMTPITRPPNGSVGNSRRPARSNTGSLSRRRGSSPSAGTARPTPRTRQPVTPQRRLTAPSRPRQSAPAARRQATPRQRPGGGSVSRPSSPRRAPAVRRSPSRSTGSSRPSGGSARPAPSRSGGGSRSPARTGGGSRRRPGN